MTEILSDETKLKIKQFTVSNVTVDKDGYMKFSVNFGLANEYDIVNGKTLQKYQDLKNRADTEDLAAALDAMQLRMPTIDLLAEQFAAKLKTAAGFTDRCIN